ncbi:hypothetical protein [Azospirillum picis]|uniref:Uncharacterized protein n=1 Tax=Azospirillum picis TaxID=488438 RepID=A0ABU0MI67_9PROT|nr:hypothetical protein [Azospirillum picis]MBP2299206.1 hypothetical protein [Azospirillum picis]MDQ0533156.1 hypothetical protein [Azospirillum picis]
MTSRMARIVHMGKLGGYAALLDGALIEIAGRMVWASADALADAARCGGIALSDLVIDTSDRAAAAPRCASPVTARAGAAWRPDRLPLAA